MIRAYMNFNTIGNLSFDDYFFDNVFIFVCDFRRWHKKAERKKQRKQGDHRALGDIKDSIQELVYYRDNILQ